MHHPAERFPPLLLPCPKFLPQLLPAPPDPFSDTCHPLSVTKVPAPRCPQTAPVPLQPLLLLRPYPGTPALPPPRPGGIPGGRGAPEKPLGDKKRPARSLPPCAPRCPEPARLRFPPCGIRGSSASCRGHRRSRRVAECSWRCAELSGGYSLPIGGVTECPPPTLQERQSAARTCPRGHLGGVGALRCSKGYPTQELGTCRCSEQRPGGAAVVKECPPAQVAVKECPPLQTVARGVNECPLHHAVAGGVKECPPVQVVARGTQECPLHHAVVRGVKECPPLQRVAKDCPPPQVVVKECPPLQRVAKDCPLPQVVVKECPPLQRVTKECPPLQRVAKECPPLQVVAKGTKECPPLPRWSLEGSKGRICSAQHLSRSRGSPRHPRGSPRPSRLAPAAVKRSGHAKKSRCASKWLW